VPQGEKLFRCRMATRRPLAYQQADYLPGWVRFLGIRYNPNCRRRSILVLPSSSDPVRVLGVQNPRQSIKSGFLALALRKGEHFLFAREARSRVSR